MAKDEFYNSATLLGEAQRYTTSAQFLQLLSAEFYGVDKFLSVGVGARLLAVTATLPLEFWGVDINQGSIERAKQFIEHWREYRNIEPFKTEFDFLYEQALEPNFSNCHLYLTSEFPKDRLLRSFDGDLASELFLHLHRMEIMNIVTDARDLLKTYGKLVFTLYPTGHPESLDKQFAAFCETNGLAKRQFIKNGVVYVDALAAELEQKDPDSYNRSKDKYWLDLENLRVHPEAAVEEICTDAGFKIKRKESIRGGMLPFAHRLVYVLSKT
ncbi:MAG: hypothetical protein ABIG30_03295 [Candidatus Aenigmatarchaeota archaeon]